jgi:hypothetical protein
MNTDQFVILVDSATKAANQIQKNSMTGDIQNDASGLPFPFSAQARVKEIRAFFPSDARVERDKVAKILKELVLRTIVDKAPLEETICVAFFLMTHLAGAPEDTSEEIEPDWNKAIRLLCSIPRLPYLHTYAEVLDFTPRERAQANAVLRLRSDGFVIGFDEGEITLGEEEESRIAISIDALVREYGGQNMAEYVLQALRPVFDPTIRRFHMVRRTSGGLPDTPPGQPLGYFINLAAKHWNVRPRPDSVTLEKIVELSIAYAALFDVQPYNIYEAMHVDADHLIIFLQKTFIYDAMFGFFQLRITDAKKLYRDLLKRRMTELKLNGDSKLSEALRVSDAIINTFCKSNGGVTFDSKIIANLLGIRAEKICQILDSTLAHAVGKANKNFLRPNDAVNASFPLRPLIKNANGRYSLVAPSLCGPAFVTALLLQGAKGQSDFWEKLGKDSEITLQKWLTSSNVEWHTGTYIAELQGKKIEGECDVVIETKDTIIFVECKNKGLRNISRTGSTEHILIDLALGLLHATSQAMRHELVLLENGAIELNRDTECYKLTWSGRHIAHLAVSLPEFGAVQDRQILKNILEGFYRANFESGNPSLIDEFAEVRKITDDFRKICNELALKRANPQHMFHDNCYMSFAQLLILLDRVNSNEDFKSEIWKTRSFGLGTNDWYHDYSWFNRAQQSVQN